MFRCIPLVIGFCVTLHVASAQTERGIIDAADFESLQTAIDAVPETGGIVRLPPGRFEITKPLLLSVGETRIEGSGASTHIVNQNTNGEPAFIIRSRDKIKNKRARLWRVQLGNFRISGNTNSGDGILADGINELFIQGMSIDHNGGHGINLVDCYEDPRVSDSILTYNARAGLNIVGGHDIVVNANHFEENQDAVRCIDSYNLCMNGNNVDDHLRHGVVIENTYGSVISGNMIEECDGVGIILDRDCYGITLSANVIAHHQGGGIQLLDAWGCTVSANTFVLVRSNALLVSSNSGHITITGNNFSNSYIGDGKTKRPVEHPKPIQRDDATGILLQNSTDIVISGNQFSGLLTPAITSEGESKRLLISGNVIADCGRGQENPQPLSLGNPSASIIKDNLISND